MQLISPSIEHVSVRSLRPYPRNARRHNKGQIKQIAASITRFGFNNPILIADDGEIVAGHGRLAAAKLLGLETVPTLRLSHLTEAERRAYVIADNKLALNAGWDQEILAIELQGLIDLDFEIELTGFSLAEVDIVLDEARESAPDGTDTAVEDTIPTYRHDAPAVSRMGDFWLLGRHKLICGCGSGRIRHRDFAMGVGEMDKDEFTRFLVDTLGLAAACCRDGSIAFVFMDWRHIGNLLSAGEQVFSELKNLCVWNKTNGGMGTFYRSKHELVFVFKVGTAPHVNTFGLGDTGRYRTNVWDYAGVNTFRAGRLEELELHPTVKPVDLVSDAIKDCSRRAGIVLDPFGGSGTTLIAAQKSGRSARLIEYDPLYCDVIIRRFQAVTGTPAILAWTGQTFEEAAAERASAEISPDPNPEGTTTVPGEYAR